MRGLSGLVKKLDMCKIRADIIKYEIDKKYRNTSLYTITRDNHCRVFLTKKRAECDVAIIKSGSGEIVLIQTRLPYNVNEIIEAYEN